MLYCATLLVFPSGTRITLIHLYVDSTIASNNQETQADVSQEVGHWYTCDIWNVRSFSPDNMLVQFSVKDLKCFHLPICFSWLCQHCESNYILKSHLLQFRKRIIHPHQRTQSLSIYHHIDNIVIIICCNRMYVWYVHSNIMNLCPV